MKQNYSTSFFLKKNIRTHVTQIFKKTVKKVQLHSYFLGIKKKNHVFVPKLELEH